MCKVYCQVTLLWKNEERARRGQCQLTVQMNDWDIRTTTFLGLSLSLSLLYLSLSLSLSLSLFLQSEKGPDRGRMGEPHKPA